MKTRHQHPSCPSCEYERASRGKAVPAVDFWQCLDCGNTWKEYGGNGNNLLTASSRETKILALRKLARTNRDHKPPPTSQSENTQEAHSPAGTLAGTFFMPVAAVALLLAIGIGSLSWHLNQPPLEMRKAGISLSEVVLKEQISHDGSKIITVRGLVENRTGKTGRIPPIAIILRQTDGGEIFRWRHTSAMPVLQPGSKSRFSSSIQYDTPAIAYAEAVFE